MAEFLSSNQIGFHKIEVAFLELHFQVLKGSFGWYHEYSPRLLADNEVSSLNVQKEQANMLCIVHHTALRGIYSFYPSKFYYKFPSMAISVFV
ncbi:unnamed protein product [Blepharisma stoltei]|uniref:Uncharacterized protein n=1 Tax=Blepharisma stoltei TaxID=1481888 RepID=A0AAU9JKZ2_9CILI|nr:unnamed protein product [Blepharisma stoltei]